MDIARTPTTPATEARTIEPARDLSASEVVATTDAEAEAIFDAEATVPTLAALVVVAPAARVVVRAAVAAVLEAAVVVVGAIPASSLVAGDEGSVAAAVVDGAAVSAGREVLMAGRPVIPRL